MMIEVQVSGQAERYSRSCERLAILLKIGGPADHVAGVEWRESEPTRGKRYRLAWVEPRIKAKRRNFAAYLDSEGSNPFWCADVWAIFRYQRVLWLFCKASYLSSAQTQG